MTMARSVGVLLICSLSLGACTTLPPGPSVVALPELLYAARQAQSITYNATPIIAAGIIYLVCLWPLVRLLSRFEHRQIALH